MTKPITAVAAMMQVEKGAFRLEDPVSRYLPGFSKMRVGELDRQGRLTKTWPAENPILIADLLTHTSGLGQGPVGEAGFRSLGLKKGDTLSSVVPRIGGLPLDFEPHSRTGYSALFAFDTLAHIIELTSGLEYGVFLDQYLFQPLGIRDITFTPDEEQRSRLVGMYAIMQDGFEPVEMHETFPGLPISYHSGGASLVGTLEDYYRFTRMLLGEGIVDGVRVLSERSVRLLRTAQLPKSMDGLEDGVNWGLSMRVITKADGCGRPLEPDSYGWSGAFGTHFWIDPTRNLVAIYATNLTTAGGAGAVTAREFEADVMRALA
jgi:CubicO group peptidase (beta-lactamase class C family)